MAPISVRFVDLKLDGLLGARENGDEQSRPSCLRQNIYFARVYYPVFPG